MISGESEALLTTAIDEQLFERFQGVIQTERPEYVAEALWALGNVAIANKQMALMLSHDDIF